MKKRIISAVSFVLSLIIFMAPMASAAVYSSDYISRSVVSTSKVSSGKVKVEFTVSGKYGVNEVGAKKVVIYESSDNETWTSKKTFYSSTTSGMITYGVQSATSSVTYSGTAGYYYKADVTVYAGTSGTGDTETYPTNSVKA